MNKLFDILLFLALTIFSVSASAQSTYKLKDLIRQQEELASAAKGYAVEMQAIIPELSIIRQQYCLERNGEFFGKNYKPFYGESYSLAVKVSGGTIFLSDVIEPWSLDDDYARDNASGNYSPSLYLTYQRSINEAIYKSINLEINEASDYVKPLTIEKNLYLHTDAINDFGLSIDTTEGNKQGSLLWVYSKTDVQDSAMVVDVRQSLFKIEAKSDSALIQMNPTMPEKIIGGIYVTPRFERGGRVQYLLSGVAVRSKSNGWDLQLLCVDDKITKSKDASNLTRTKCEGKAAQR